jgi:hypothetical protein
VRGAVDFRTTSLEVFEGGADSRSLSVIGRRR